MRYIKTYEKKWKPKYKIGDYVLVYSPPNMANIMNEPMIITEIDITEQSYWCEFVFDHYYDTIFEDEIIKKLESHEVEALKYNL